MLATGSAKVARESRKARKAAVKTNQLVRPKQSNAGHAAATTFRRTVLMVVAVDQRLAAVQALGMVVNPLELDRSSKHEHRAISIDPGSPQRCIA